MEKHNVSAGVITATKTAPKLGERSSGRITYQSSVGPDGECFIAISGNDSSGYFSREPVSLTTVEKCLPDSPLDKPFTVRALRAAFVGRSVNNAGFLAAALRTEGLIQEAALPRQYLRSGDWTEWKAEQQRMAAGVVAADGFPALAPPGDARETGKPGKTGKTGKPEKAKEKEQDACDS